MAAPSWIRGKLLGAGAFGSVHLAVHREDGAVFAAKSVPVDANAEVALRAIENEISVLQGLDSRFVVRCFGSDWTEESGRVMRNAFLEYMPAGCLTDFVKQFAKGGALDEHLLRTYTRSVVEAIDYLHGQGIVHCDIKGQNILVGNGSVKLTDFGSAKLATGTDGAPEGAQNCKVNGTPLWMAPEVVNQVVQGPASDIWSLGCTVVEMATGRAPWSNLAGMSNQFVALYHIGCTDALPAVPQWLSAEAHDFLSHCFERDPRRRWTSSQLLQHPFLTSPLVQPASPKRVAQFPVADVDSDSDSSDCFVNSVPQLPPPPPPSKRTLVVPELASAGPDHVEEPNGWTSPHSSGPWIVVRSPPGSPRSSLNPLSDWTTPTTPPTSEHSVLDCERGEADPTAAEEKRPPSPSPSPSASASQARDEASSSSAQADATCEADAVFDRIQAAQTGTDTDANTCSGSGSHCAVALGRRRRESCDSGAGLPGSVAIAAWGANWKALNSPNSNSRPVLVSQCWNSRWHCHSVRLAPTADVQELHGNSWKPWGPSDRNCTAPQFFLGDESAFSLMNRQKASFARKIVRRVSLLLASCNVVCLLSSLGLFVCVAVSLFSRPPGWLCRTCCDSRD